MNNWDLILRGYLLSTALQLLMWPVIKKWFGKLVDGGWALGRVMLLVVVSLAIWVLGNLGMAINTNLGVLAMLLVVLLRGLMVLREGMGQRRKKTMKKITKFWEEKWKFILVEELLFLIGFLGQATVRSYAPKILGLEKFMDFGFIKQYLISDRLPVNDMWLAGQSINYYSFGHLMASVMIRIWGVSPGVGYNLMLAWILGMSLVLSFSIVINASEKLAKKKNKWKLVIGGLVGSLAVSLGGNTHTLWYLLENKNLESYWYADATRFIENTIHEFPGYSFVVSDLHAHLLGLPVVLTFLLMAVSWLKSKETKSKTNGRKVVWLEEPFMGGLLGTMIMTNTWDVAVYGLVLGILYLSLLIGKKMGWKRLMLSGIVVLGMATLVSAQWWLNFNSIPQGIVKTTERSPWWQLVVLWGGLGTTTILALVVNLVLKRKGKKKKLGMVNPWVMAVGVSAMLLLVIPELIYVKDIYTTHQRANTMFKLTYQAFILMGLVMGWLVNRLVIGRDKEKRWWRGVLIVPVVVLFAFQMLFDYKAFGSYYGKFKVYKGIDGLAWYRNEEIDKWGVVKYLEENRDRKNMVEAVGDSYSELNSVSVFSGTPTIMGWRVHEWLWRGGYDIVAERERAVKIIYESGKLEETREFLRLYNVGWILVGPDERLGYHIDDEKLMSLGKLVWQGEETYLIQVD